jgi:SAM-dependent methyltransferase
VLEIGCGKGQFLERLRASAVGAGRTLIGLELSKAVEAVRDAGFAAVKADGERLPLRNASVAAVVYQGALHHVIGYLEAVREALRVLVPGGRLVIFEPTTTTFSLLVHRLLDPIVFRTTCEYESPVDVHYKEHFSEAEVVRELERAGLGVRRERSDFLAYPFTGCYAGSWFARRPRVMQGLMRLERAVERAPALGRLARTFAWRVLIVAEKTRSR